VLFLGHLSSDKISSSPSLQRKCEFSKCKPLLQCTKADCVSEYYFSIENLCKDMFLRKHMDSKGFVFLSVIADFNRIKQLTTDMELIKFACYHSREIEYRIGADGRDRIRRCDGWEQWVLPTGDRDLSAQNDGPDEVHHPPIPHPQGVAQGFDPFMMRYAMGPMSGPTSPGLHQDPSFPTMNSTGINGAGSGPVGGPGMGDASGFPHPATNTDAMSPQGPGAPMFPGTHMMPGNMEADSFSDEQVEALTIIVRKQDPAQASIPSNPLAGRTFSNGTIDGRSTADEPPNLEARQNGPKVNGHVPAQG
jgi:la-related protein 1